MTAFVIRKGEEWWTGSKWTEKYANALMLFFSLDEVQKMAEELGGVVQVRRGA